MGTRRVTVFAAAALAAAALVGGLVYDGTHLTPRAVAEPAPVLGGIAVDAITTELMDGHPALRIRVQGTDDGKIDTLAGQFLSDVLDYWDETPMPHGAGFFAPPHIAASFDSRTGEGVSVCVDTDTVNAAACRRLDGQTSVEWDRGVLLPALMKSGNMLSIGVVMAHEVAHLVDHQVLGDVPNQRRSASQTLISEQRADCFSGAWMGWLAEGNSRRFTADPTALNGALNSVINFRDTETNDGHGIGVERVGALLDGFTRGPDVCATYDLWSTQERRVGMDLNGSSSDPARWEPLTDSYIADIQDAVGEATGSVAHLSDVPCTDPSTPTGAPANWCASRQEVAADMNILAYTERVYAAGSLDIPEGPGHKIGPLLAALAQPYLTTGGRTSTSGETACAVGVLSQSLVSRGSGSLLDFGDLDEILAETLDTGRSAAASDGTVEEWGFNRAVNLLDGMRRVGTVAGCLGR